MALPPLLLDPLAVAVDPPPFERVPDPPLFPLLFPLFRGAAYPPPLPFAPPACAPSPRLPEPPPDAPPPDERLPPPLEFPPPDAPP
ncbi:MAG TPA: hypothetical protein VKI43_18835, partial [Vicinamibacterales bacterium]|nr:hypothetical protein [Vicinamibacterales bacterium]